MLPRIEMDTSGGIMARWAWKHELQQLRQKDLWKEAERFQPVVDDYLRDGDCLPDDLAEYRRFLTVAGYILATDGGDLKTVLQKSLSEGAARVYENWFSFTVFALSKRQRAVLEGLKSDNGFECLYRPEIRLTEAILEGIVSFGLWRSLEVANRSGEIEFEKPVRHVGAVGMDWRGGVLAEGFRGEGGERHRHAEENMLMNCKEAGLIERLSVVATNLEPCLERSSRHVEALGHGNGCSTLLIQSPARVVAFLTSDLGESGRGRGGEKLVESHVLVMQANHQDAIRLGMESNGHFEDFKQRLTSNIY